MITVVVIELAPWGLERRAALQAAVTRVRECVCIQKQSTYADQSNHLDYRTVIKKTFFFVNCQHEYDSWVLLRPNT